MRLFLQHVKTYFLYSILLGFNAVHGMEMFALQAAKTAAVAKTAVKTATEATTATENQMIQNAAQQSALSQAIVRSSIKPVWEAGTESTQDTKSTSSGQPYLSTLTHQFNQESSPLQSRPSLLNPADAHHRTQFNNHDNGISRALSTMRRFEMEAAAKKAAEEAVAHAALKERIEAGQRLRNYTIEIPKTFNEFVDAPATESFIQEYNVSAYTLGQMGREITFDPSQHQQAFKDSVELNRLNAIPEVKRATEAAAHLNLHGYCLSATGNKELGSLCLEGAKELNNYARCIANEHRALNHEGLNQAALYSKEASVHLIKAITMYEKLAGLSLPPVPASSVQLAESTLVNHIKTHVRTFNTLPFDQQSAQIDKTISNLQGPGVPNDIARLKTLAVNQHAHMLELIGNTAVSRDTAYPLLDIAGTLKLQAEHLSVIEQRLSITVPATNNADAVSLATIPGKVLHTKIEQYKKLYADHKQLGAEASQKGDILFKQRCDARVKALESCDSPEMVIRNFSPETKAFLTKNGIDSVDLETMHGDALQLRIHQELCDIVETTTDLAARNILQEPQTDMLLTFAMGIDHANRFGNAQQALTFTDFCHGILDCGRAIGSGAQTGVQNLGQNVSEQPLVYAAETVGAVVATWRTLGARLVYETTKLAASMHLEGIHNLPPGTLLSDNPMVQQLLSQSAEAGTQQAQAVTQQQFSTDTIPGCIEYATRVGTEFVGHGGITYGTGRAIHHLAQKPFVARTLQRSREYLAGERMYPQAATAVAAQSKGATTLQQSVSRIRVTQSASASTAIHLTETEFAQLLKNKPLATIAKKFGPNNTKKALELHNINQASSLENNIINSVEATAKKLKIINSNPKEWPKLTCDPTTGTITNQSIDQAYTNIKSMAINVNKGAAQSSSSQTISQMGKDRFAIPKVVKNAKPGSNPQPVLSAKITDTYKTGIHKKAEIFKKDGKVWNHVFSDKHVDEGILNLGKNKLSLDQNKQYIFEKFKRTIFKVDNAGILVEGDNEIRFIMNGCEATIRLRVENNILMNWDAFQGYSDKIIGQLIIW